MGVARYAAGVTLQVKCPATLNRLVTQLFRSHRGYAQKCFDNIFVHNRAMNGQSDVDNHIDHLRAVIECMRTNKLYANVFKFIFCAEEITFYGGLLGSEASSGSR